MTCDHCGNTFNVEEGGQVMASQLPGLGEIEFHQCQDCLNLDKHLTEASHDDD